MEIVTVACPACNRPIVALHFYKHITTLGGGRSTLLFHLLLTPGEETSLERAIQFVKGGSAKKLGDELQFRSPVWQRGFTDHRIRDAADYDQHAAYIARNPVKRHLVAEAREYAWSSASGKFAMDEAPQGLKPLSLGATVRHG